MSGGYLSTDVAHLLEIERRRSQLYLDLTSDCCFVTDVNGTIRHADDRLAELAGVQTRFLPGEPFVDFVVPDDRTAFRDALTVLPDVLVGSMALRIQGRDGVVRSVELSAGAFVATEDDSVELHWRLIDVTASHTLEDRVVWLNQQNQLLKEAYRLRGSLADPEVIARLVDKHRELAATALDAVAQVSLIDEFGVALPLGPVAKPADAAVQSMVAAPIFKGNVTVGALTVYGERPGMFSEEHVEIVQLFAYQISFLLRNMDDYRVVASRADGLELAMKTRATIEQAKGMIMARKRCTADDAFEELRRLSQKWNVRINEIARRMTAMSE